MRCLTLWDNVFLGKNDFSSVATLMRTSSDTKLKRCFSKDNNDCVTNGNNPRHSAVTPLKNENESESNNSRNSETNSHHLNNNVNGIANGALRGGGGGGDRFSFSSDLLDPTDDEETACVVVDKKGSSNSSSNNDLIKNENEDNLLELPSSSSANDGAATVKMNNICKLTSTCDNDVTIASHDDETGQCNDSSSQETIVSNGSCHNDAAMTDSCRTLTGDDNQASEHRKSLDDLCLASGSGIINPSLISLECHSTNGMRRTHSSPDSPTMNRLVRTKSVPDVTTTSLCVANNVIVGKQYENDGIRDNSYECRSFVDEDGLTQCYNYLEQKLVDIELRHAQELQKLQKKLELERQARVFLQQQIYRDGGVAGGAVNLDVFQDDLVCTGE